MTPHGLLEHLDSGRLWPWDMVKPAWADRTAVIRNVKYEVVRSETRWIFLKGKSAEELQQQGCSRMLKTTPAWQDPVWLGILRQTSDMYRVAG